MTREELHKESKLGVQGIWHFHEFNESDFSGMTDDEIEQKFKDQIKKFNNKETGLKFPKGLTPSKTVVKNQVVQGLLDTIIHRMINNYTGTEDLIARKIAIGLSNVVTNINNAQLGLEFFRADFTDTYQDLNKAHFYIFVGRNIANGNDSLVVADSGNSTTQFKITTGENVLFNIGDRIRVTTDQFNLTNITNIDALTDIITVSPALNIIPSAGSFLMQVWAEAGIFGNQNTGSSFNTGTMFNRVNNLNYAKDDSKIILIEVQFIFTAI